MSEKRRMKNSGIQWIGNIPENWNICKTKNIANLYTGNSIKDEEKEKYTTNNINSVPYISTKDILNSFNTINYDNGMFINVEDKNFKFAEKGSTLVCIEGGSAGRKKAFLNQKVAFVNKLCCFSPSNIYNKYLYYFLNSPNYENEFNHNITGLIGGVSVSVLKNVFFILPPSAEQQKIANFLDCKCDEIDNIISKTKATIEEYKKLKQSIITTAVTKGIIPNRPMKDSGIEWIGTIPRNWKTIKMKYLGEYRNGLTYSPTDITDENKGCLVLRSSNIKNGKISLLDNVYVSSRIPEQLKVKKGDILICSRNGSRELIGKNAIIEENMIASFGAFMMIFKTDKPKYIYYILNSNLFSYYLSSFLTSTINQLTGKNFGGMEIVYCTDEKEQQEIVKYLDEKCSEIDNLIQKKEQLLTELENYKKSLIYEYVTGKKWGGIFYG